jgi:hypothetical protein
MAGGMPQIIWFVESQMFLFFNTSVMFLDVDCYGMVYCVHCPLSLMFSHPLFWKLDLFLLSDARRESFPSFLVKPLPSYSRPFPKCDT